MNNIPRYIMIKDHPHLMRDTQTMGLINLNKSGLSVLQKRREAVRVQNTLNQQQKMEINSLRSEVDELKAILYKLLEEKKG
jgi:hypothetical protein